MGVRLIFMLMFISLKRSFVNNQGCFCAFSLWTETKREDWIYLWNLWEPGNLCLKDRGLPLCSSHSRRQDCRLERHNRGVGVWVLPVLLCWMSGVFQLVQSWILWYDVFSIRVWLPWFVAWDAGTVAALAYYTCTDFVVSCRDARVLDSRLIIHGVHDQSTVYCVGLHSHLR